MEDLDPPREQTGAAEAIITTLTNWGLHSDAPVLFQSERLHAYQKTSDQLLETGKAYRCDCSRKQVATEGLASPEGWRYSGRCRERQVASNKQHCIRLDSRSVQIQFTDELQGPQQETPEQLYGDFPIRRADEYFAYQLAVVVDDAYQGVTHVVRGIDLLSSTSRQICLQQKLGLTTPNYCHLPVLIGEDGQKLSKQNLAKPVPVDYDLETMRWLLDALALDSDQAPLASGPKAALEWAAQHWQPQRLAQLKQLAAAPSSPC
jgi:glutamyl-Q tRNA(Asp) synthetase